MTVFSPIVVDSPCRATASTSTLWGMYSEYGMLNGPPCSRPRTSTECNQAATINKFRHLLFTNQGNVSVFQPLTRSVIVTLRGAATWVAAFHCAPHCCCGCYGCFLVIEAHGGRCFRTPCPDCRAEPFNVPAAAPRPRKRVGSGLRSQ